MDRLVPEWLDYASDEHKAVAMFRGLQGLSGNWGELIATAQTVMSYYSDMTWDSVDELYDERRVVPLIAAAHILDTASQFEFSPDPEEPTSEEVHQSIALTAAVAFSMYGNFPSSLAAVHRAFGSNRVLSTSTAILIATIAPTYSASALDVADHPGNRLERQYLDNLTYFLNSGDERRIDDLRTSFIQCLIHAPTSLEKSLLRSARLSLEHLIRLSVARTLREHQDKFPNETVSRIIGTGLRVFLPPQFRAITQTRILTGDGNGIVALPTSTGKTLLGALCLLSSLGQEPGLVCYLAPYVALGSQVAQTLSAIAPRGIRVHRMMGGFRETDPLDPVTRQEIIVATPERLDGLLRMSPQLLPYLRCVIFDEAHTIQNDTRGILLEGIVTRLRMLQESGNNHRIILLSAVLSEYQSLQRWLGIEEDSVVTDTWRPTARRIAFWGQQDERLTWFVGESPVRRPTERSSSIIGRQTLPWPNKGFFPTDNFGSQKKQRDLIYENVAYLTHRLYTDFGGPLLCVSATKDSTRRVAQAMASHFMPLSPLPTSLVAIIHRIETGYSFLRSLVDPLERGVAFHNSSVPHEIRALIEEAVKSRDLRVVASTTTLAEGVDLPFRFSVLVDWITWQDPYQPLSPLLFRNISGRCGRSGEFTEGDTIFVDNPVGDQIFTLQPRRREIQRGIFLSEGATELRSALEQQPSSAQQRAAFEAALGSQIIAAVPENPDDDDLASKFSAHTFAAQQVGSTDTIHQRIHDITDFLLDETEEPLARAASPMRLTALGRAVNNTGLSPGSSRRVMKSVQEMALPDISLLGLSRLAGQLLENLADLPEQRSRNLRKVVANPKSRFAIKPDDFAAVVADWISGQSLEDTFSALPYVRRSKRKPNVDAWLAGTMTAPTWDDEYDDVVEFSQSVLEYFLPWVLRACWQLSAFIGEEWTSLPWRMWADFLEMGVDSRWAAAARRRNAPGGRRAIALFGREWVAVDDLPDADNLGIFLLGSNPLARQEVEALFSVLIYPGDGPESPESTNFRHLRAWLFDLAGFYATPQDVILPPR